jgi:predicted nucleic acid-binding protein
LILVDTSAWIEWSNDAEGEVAIELDRLLAADDVATTDMVIAEILQGSRTQPIFDDWILKLEGPHYFGTAKETWLRAAALSFQLMRRGQTTALSDLLIAQVALDNDLTVFATDTDFERVPGLKLHKASSRT